MRNELCPDAIHNEEIDIMTVNIGRRTLFLSTMAAVVASSFSGHAAASGGASGPRVTFAPQGKLGEIIVNPYKIAPLTASIKNGGYEQTRLSKNTETTVTTYQAFDSKYFYMFGTTYYLNLYFRF